MCVWYVRGVCVVNICGGGWGGGVPRVPWSASLGAGGAGSRQARHSCVIGVTRRGRRPEGALEGIPRGWRRRSVKTDEAFLSLGALAAGRGGSGSGLGGCPPPRPVSVARGESMYDWGLVRDRERQKRDRDGERQREAKRGAPPCTQARAQALPPQPAHRHARAWACTYANELASR